MKQVLKRYFPALRDHEVTQDSDRTTMVPASAIGVDLIIYTLLAFWSNAQVLATLTNITIDDTDSTFWSWAGSWHAVTPTTPCPGCAAQPDPALVYNSTWHDGSLRSGAFTFQGTAVYIYGIDFSGQSSAGTILFTLRNTSVTAFHDDFAEDYVYNSLYFSATDLDSSIQHTVTWTLDSNPGDGAGLFDYAVVTVNQRDPYSNSASSTTNAAGRATVVGSSPFTAPSESATPTASPAAPGNAHTAAIVGAVVGAVGGLALFSAVFIFLHRRRVAATNYSIEPYPPERFASKIGALPSSLHCHLCASCYGFRTSRESDTPC
ncbi:hypothetical protein B0H11DRAFT_2376358 [Mycena galericulata]|nr:hypothetical protein B0H11DRAFT_2376358 [Mycena galericulata]